MKTIKLAQGEWQYDPARPLGKAGGFGEVFHGTGGSGEVAVKRLKLTASQAAHRELAIAQQLRNRDLKHVVPILDAGQDADSDRYFLVMPVCERNLQEAIDKEQGQLKLDVALETLRAIVAGLVEVNDLVHRDLKPANVLLHNGIWKIADFGIAKFVEDSTSLETLRASLTPLYAAPEQWRLERPTGATDIYALGCIVYAVITGNPPFTGTLDQVREGHLTGTPRAISTCPPRLATFASMLLRKPPQSRPTLTRCKEVFAENHMETKALSPARHAMTQAAAQVEERSAREEAARARNDALRKARSDLAKAAIADLNSVVEKVKDEIAHIYEKAKSGHKGMLEFGNARFGLTRPPEATDQYWWHRADLVPLVQQLNWDIVAWGVLAVTIERGPGAGGYTWSATVLYADRKDGAGFRWYEVAFFTSALSRNRRERDEPYALELHEADFFQALSPAMHSVEVAYAPMPIDGEDEDKFIQRWLGLVAKAATGALARPRMMPVREFS
jgi:serine/threonine-protein kinase